jgi:hypothetical protein
MKDEDDDRDGDDKYVKINVRNLSSDIDEHGLKTRFEQ